VVEAIIILTVDNNDEDYNESSTAITTTTIETTTTINKNIIHYQSLTDVSPQKIASECTPLHQRTSIYMYIWRDEV